MRMLLVHNEYLQPGGEDVVATAEGALLGIRSETCFPVDRRTGALDIYGTGALT